jgi:hypothetical protein
MAIVRLTKTRDQKVNELLGMFKLPGTDYVKPAPEPPTTTGSAINSTEATRLHAVNELRRWTRLG